MNTQYENPQQESNHEPSNEKIAEVVYGILREGQETFNLNKPECRELISRVDELATLQEGEHKFRDTEVVLILARLRSERDMSDAQFDKALNQLFPEPPKES